MTGIDLLVEEHKNIIRFTEVLKKICCNIIQGQEADTVLLRQCIEFGRNYADKHHHGKEEKILFRIMQDSLGTTAQKLIRNGMLVEHDLGRYYVMELENAINEYEKNKSVENKLEIIANAAGYANLLKRHIEKEDNVVYSFAKNSLSEEDKKRVNEETELFEAEEKCTILNSLEQMEEKVNL